LKIAVAGKGGVGKTLIAGTLARLLARDGFSVLAIDADPAMNLAFALGVPPEVASGIVPIAENRQLIEERTGVAPGSGLGGLINLTPTVRDIADKYGVLGPDGVRLLVMGTVRSGGSGCMCPANTLIGALIRHVTLLEGDTVIMDMEAGLEHLGRATVRGFDVLVCVVEPGGQSIQTALRIKRLAEDINVRSVVAVLNKVRAAEDEKIVKESLEGGGLEVIHSIPYDENIIRADISRISPIDRYPSTPAITAINQLKEKLKSRYYKKE
jgi:CO dehydrogenase maturation factor